MPELTQEQLINEVAKAITFIETARPGHIPMTMEIQASLETRGIFEPISRIKEATDIIAELEDEAPEMYKCQWCGAWHPMNAKEWLCPLAPKKDIL